MRNAYNILVVKPEGKRPLGRIKHRWEDTIRIDLGEIGWECVDWTHPAQDKNKWRAFVNMAMNLWVPQTTGNFSTS
jgi:hypothetical protein